MDVILKEKMFVGGTCIFTYGSTENNVNVKLES